MFFQMMNEWFTQFMQNNLMAPRPLPPPFPSNVLIRPQNVNQVLPHRPPTDKIWKCGVEEFLGLYNDDPTKAEYWLVNVQCVFDELKLLTR